MKCYKCYFCTVAFTKSIFPLIEIERHRLDR